MRIAMIALVACVFAGGLAQVKNPTRKSDTDPQSIEITYAQGLGINYVFDGMNSFAGISYSPQGFWGEKASLGLLHVVAVDDPARQYTGLWGAYKVIDLPEFAFTVGIGYKGFDWRNKRFAEERGFIFGFNVFVPLKVEQQPFGESLSHSLL